MPPHHLRIKPSRRFVSNARADIDASTWPPGPTVAKAGTAGIVRRHLLEVRFTVDSGRAVAVCVHSGRSQPLGVAITRLDSFVDPAFRRTCGFNCGSNSMGVTVALRSMPGSMDVGLIEPEFWR